jgi:hypothetical protein
VSAPQDEVHEFAGLLKRLKERTDRSYGQLARRLNMNTSTLHRYCAGEAVPLDYAPVERFAALCGATAEERLELHRLWLLAVAARQRPRTPTPTPDTTDDTGDGSPTPEEEPHRPWFRRRRFLVTAAVATALLATLGSLSALPADRPSGDVTAEDAPSTRTTAPGNSSHRPPGTTSPSPSPTTGSPSAAKPSDKTTPKPTAKGGVPSGPEGQGEKEPAPAVPLTWTVNSQVWNQGCGHDYVIGKPPAQVPPPPTAQDAGTWAAAQGALHGRDTNVQISVQGRSSTAVVLEALRVRVVSRGAPVQGSAYSMDQGCGGALTPRFFSVNLDADRPVAHSEAGGDAEGPIPAIQMPYRVSAEDPEILLVTARTETCDCAWYLELDWSSQGRTGTVRIDDHGRPFRTTSIKGLPRYSYDTSARQWVPYS